CRWLAMRVSERVADGNRMVDNRSTCGRMTMVCAKCNQELAADARFCSRCGAPAPQAAGIEVTQDIGTVSGEVVGVTMGGAPPAGIVSRTDQKVDTVASGGTVVGTVVGGAGQTNIGGQHTHGDVVQGDAIRTGDISGSSGVAIGRGASSTVRNVNTGGGDYAE